MAVGDQLWLNWQAGGTAPICASDGNEMDTSP